MCLSMIVWLLPVQELYTMARQTYVGIERIARFVVDKEQTIYMQKERKMWGRQQNINNTEEST